MTGELTRKEAGSAADRNEAARNVALAAEATAEWTKDDALAARRKQKVRRTPQKPSTRR